MASSSDGNRVREPAASTKVRKRPVPMTVVKAATEGSEILRKPKKRSGQAETYLTSPFNALPAPFPSSNRAVRQLARIKVRSVFGRAVASCLATSYLKS